jgi:hypothetical protein
MYLAAVLAPGLFSQQPAPPPRATTVARQVVTSNHGTSYLGVAVVDIDADRAKALNLKEERGVEVKSVKPDSPADKAGIKEGDGPRIQRLARGRHGTVRAPGARNPGGSHVLAAALA